MVKKAASKTFARISSQPVDGASLSVFRIVVGCTFFAGLASYLAESWVEYFYVSPKFHFKYYGFSWVRPLAGDGMRALFQLMLVTSVLVAAGVAYRVTSLLLAVGYTYIFLLDKSQYQNHYYLLMLTAWVMACLPAHRALSFDRFFHSKRQDTVPRWTVWLLRFQVGLPYFFGGVAKLNSDWINGQPMRMKLANSTWYPVIGPFFAEEWCVQIFVWGGLLFDLAIVPLLLCRRTRLPAFAVSVCFHLMNATLFNIGVFPWFMIFASTIFFEPEWPRVFRFRGEVRMPNSKIAPTKTYRPLLAAVMVYVMVQVALPFRHQLYAGNVNWTEKGHFFAWHMKLRDKKSVSKFKWVHKATGKAGDINVLKFITPQQAAHATGDPEMIVQLCRFLKEDLQRQGLGDCAVYALNLTSLNGRKPQPLVNPLMDLASVPRSVFLPTEVYTSLSEPLNPFTPWRIARHEWTQHIDIPNRVFWLGTTKDPALENEASVCDLPLRRSAFDMRSMK